jgi:hypothetical protein
MRKPFGAIVRSVVLVAASAGLGAACGGSARVPGDGGGEAERAGAAGRSGSATGNAAGAAGQNREAAGGASAAGSSGADTGDHPCGGASCAGSGGIGPCGEHTCGPGYKLILEAGAACPKCLPDPDACANGQRQYREARAEFLAEPSALSCSKDADCTFLAGSASCGDACAADPVSVAAASAIDQTLTWYSSQFCSSCSPSFPPCVAPPSPVCANGVCILGGSA